MKMVSVGGKGWEERTFQVKQRNCGLKKAERLMSLVMNGGDRGKRCSQRKMWRESSTLQAHLKKTPQ